MRILIISGLIVAAIAMIFVVGCSSDSATQSSEKALTASSTSLMLFAGAGLAAIAHKFVPKWAARFLLSVSAGLVAGESLFGVASVWF